MEFIPQWETNAAACRSTASCGNRAMRATYPVLRERCVTERPDVVCYDATNWPARIVAETLGIPAVRCVPNLASVEQRA